MHNRVIVLKEQDPSNADAQASIILLVVSIATKKADANSKSSNDFSCQNDGDQLMVIAPRYFHYYMHSSFNFMYVHSEKQFISVTGWCK